MTTTVDNIKMFLAECRDHAREQGWNGADTDYNYTSSDLEYVTDNLGVKPTAEQWREAGLQWVGSKHCG